MLYIYAFLLSTVLTFIIREFYKNKSIIDTPNERSSHTVPTPSGGGLAIIIVFYIGLFYFQSNIDIALFCALLSALPVAMVSLLDDIVTLSSKVRFLVQSVSAAMALYFLGGVFRIDFILFSLDGVWVNILVLIAILWITNLYNFLDGIDGYAGSQALILGLGLFVFFHNPLGIVIMSASLGFLVFNWHKASIFMGDVGSATLGFLFSIFAFHSLGEDQGEGYIYIWLILLSLFWIDATLTLFKRYLNGEKLSQAHKKHAYQRLVQSGWTHGKVTTYALIFNFIFFVLLYFSKSPLIVFLVNIISIYGIVEYIDRKKSFK